MWTLQRSPVMIAIPGTSSLRHLEENCAAATMSLSDSQFEELTDARKALRRWVLTS
jgi:pyridoxine 4-dehydrogenase